MADETVIPQPIKKLDRQAFYQHLKDARLITSFSQHQVDCVELLISKWEETNISDWRQFAYLMGTVFHESGHTLTPLTEYGSEAYLKAKKYYPYIGRGFVQITWERNYELFGKLLGVDLVNDMQLSLDPSISANIAILGMTKGLFTGVSLSKYFNATTEDWINARKIINGKDAAEKIANYSKIFNEGIKLI